MQYFFHHIVVAIAILSSMAAGSGIAGMTNAALISEISSFFLNYRHLLL